MLIVGLPVIVIHPVNTTVNVSDNVLINCTVRSYGDVDIVWKKFNSTTLPSRSATLTIREIRSVNEVTSVLNISSAIGYYKGYYYCTIKNSAGERNSTMAYLDVVSK